MKRKNFTRRILAGLLAALSVAAYAEDIDLEKVNHWTGSGPNRAALAIQFNGTTCGSDALVWGYRWADGDTPTVEDMFKAICQNSSRLSMLTQYTGSMGSTVCGIGYGLSQEVLHGVSFDFEKAKQFEFINFDYYTANSLMGQTSAPGDDTPLLAQAAIDQAIGGTHYIQHPLDYRAYGYPAYDYDCWIVSDDLLQRSGSTAYEPKWAAGWYEGYWSFWHRSAAAGSEWLYSGAGFSTTGLADGASYAWSYTEFETPQVGGMGEGTAPCEESIYYVPQPIGTVSPDAQKAVRRIGEGNVSMPLIVKFGNAEKLDNAVLSLAFDGLPPTASGVLTLLAADPAFTLDGNTLSIDADGDGAFNTSGSDASATGDWQLTEYEDALVLACTDAPRVDYLLYLPEPGEPAAVLPEQMACYLSDAKDFLPVYVQRAEEYDAINYMFYRRTDEEKIQSSTSTDIITGISTANATLGQLTYKGNKAGDLCIHVRVRTGKGAAYSYSNVCHFTLLPPLRPIESIAFAENDIDAPLNSVIENAMAFYPEDATYTALTYASSNTKVVTANATAIRTTTTAGEATVSVASTWNPEVKAEFGIVSSLKNPVEGFALQGVEGDTIVLNPKRMIGILCDVTPANADIKDFNVSLDGAGTERESIIASMYKVNYWDENNTRIQFYELSGHHAGECTLTITATDGSDTERTYIVRVEEQDRTPLEDGYADGTIILNEEWFTHTNGGLNYITPEGSVMYQVYERENPGMSFGATSQYGVIWAGKLIVASKQAADGGDPLPGGGRLVVSDAKTLKWQGGIDDLKYGEETSSADGRAIAGASPSKVYVGSTNGIYIVDIDEVKVIGKITDFDESGSAAKDLYSGQIGDMVRAGKYVFGIKQNTGAFAIDTETDQIVKQYAMPTVQGIAQSADGNVWTTANIDGQMHLTCINPETLEVDEEQSVVLPASVGTVVCSWGAWRSTPFVGSYDSNTLWFNTGGGITGGSSSDRFYGWEIGSDPAGLTPLFALDVPEKLAGSNSRVFQKTYGTLRYDDRSKELIVMTTEDSASGHYRYNWIHFIDVATGTIRRTIALEPYYWFQAFAIFPDKHDTEMDLDAIELEETGEGCLIDLAEKVTDADNIDRNIMLSLSDEQPDEVAEVMLEGKILKVSPIGTGTKYVTLTAMSNGREVSHTVGISVNPDVPTGIAGVQTGSVSCDGRRLYICGFNGKAFSLHSVSGALVSTFTADSDNYVYDFGSHSGTYVLSSDRINVKIAIR